MAKDFKAGANAASEAGRIATAIKEATQEPQEPQKRRPGRPRKRAKDNDAMHINLELTSNVYDYVKVMAAARRISMTDFIIEHLENGLAENEKDYKQAKKFFDTVDAKAQK